MKSPLLFVMVTMLMLGSSAVFSQVSNPVIVDLDKKVIYSDSLTLPKNINVGSLIRLLPELLQRPDNYTLSNYDVQIDGVSVGESSDALLAILELADIEKVEVNFSPTATELNGGQSGAINIILRPTSKGVAGKVSLRSSTESSSMGEVLLDYGSSKVTVRGVAYGELNKASKSSTIIIPRMARLENKDDSWSQMTRAMITYSPDTRNKFELTLTEETKYAKTISDVLSTDDQGMDIISSKQHDRKAQLYARLNYFHNISSTHSIKLSAIYGQNPLHIWAYNSNDEQIYNQRTHNNVAEGSAELNASIPFSDGNGSWGYKVGLKGATSTFNKQVQPLCELMVDNGTVKVKVAAEYQWNKEGKSDMTGRMLMEWLLSRASMVRLQINRQLNLPYMIAHQFGADYITNLKWNRHLLTLSGGLSYCSCDDTPIQSSYGNANLMAIYQYDIFFLSLTANLYSQKFDVDNPNSGNHEYKNFYNISIMPSLNFRNGWRTMLNMRYYSKVTRLEEELGDCLSLQMSVGKTWKNLTVYAYGRLPVTGKTEDIDRATGLIMQNYLVPTSIGGGLSLSF